MAQDIIPPPQIRAPTHPGAILREDVLPALGLTAREAARAIGVPHRHFRRVLAEEADVTAEMALSLGTFLGNGSGLWLRMQDNRNAWETQTRR